MQTLSLELPAMYGDHHVNEVRRILLGVSGIKTLYASSYLRTIDLSYDPERITPSMVEGLLAEAGYLTASAIEANDPDLRAPSDQADAERRQAALDLHASTTISFVQHVPVVALSAWPCPGLGVVTTNGKER